MYSAKPNAPTVVVVADEWVVRATIADRLKQEGCVVVEAGDGETALAILEERDGFDVLFTDIRLRTSGLAAT